MKKILLSLFIFLFIPGIISAASANIQISAPDSVYVGDTVKVSVTVSSGSSLGNWNYIINYDDSILEYVSTDADTAQSVFGEASNGGQTSATNTWTFRAKSAGSASFNVSSISVISWDEISEMSIGGYTSTSIDVIKPSSGGSNGGYDGGYSNYTYSDDNDLSSLTIEGFDIDFDSSVTEYSISVPNDTKKVKIGASANDGNASVEGIGDYDVKEGNNEINIVVTAENGDTKVYKINVVVKELDPIEVTIGDKKYSVIRKSDKLPKANDTYKASTILIKGESVPCYHSDITGIYLVGLVDDKGKTILFNYDSKNDKFIVYNELNIGGIYISLIDSDDSFRGYTKGLVKVGDKEYSGYLKEGSYPLLYGINLETGEKNYYTYDSTESTLQKVMASNSGVSSDNSKAIIYSLIGLCAFEFIIIIASVISKNKQLKKYSSNKDIKDDKVLSEISEDNLESDVSEQVSENEEVSEVPSVSEETEENVNKDVSDETIESNESEALSDTDDSGVSFNTEEIEDSLGKTALISKSVTNVYNNTKNRKESIKERKALRKNKNKKDDDMFKF